MRTDRREGQIWIDKEAPYNLRYFVNKTEYTVAMSASYDIDENYTPHSGNVVILNNNGKIAPAVFPTDIENVIGVVASNPQTNDNLKKADASSKDGRVEVIHSGYIEVKTDTGVFVDGDENLIKNTIFTKNTIIGTPVYWFIGREDLDIDQEAGKGKLTLGTPCGFIASTEDGISRNVDYDNLPQVGNIVKVDLDESNVITTFYIHLNFSKFDASIEWIYPKTVEEAATTHDVLIEHGLFPKKTGTKRIESFADTTVDQAGEVFNCIFPITNNTSGDQRGTKLYAKTDEAVSIKIHGQVSYIG